ncbi:uncharacterized protein LOC129742066 [Uranotaenia lowii]|uniref:uncharacterized protein LOC129742066 n=1 Tax=Uranotaenia lowii TaxID=190385 RepID=UPI00247A43B6|nr:uncharacterized protein LOC129742066 [Uranotaenia lowii]
MRGHHNLGTMGNIINRISNTTQQSANTKPIVFSQTCNQLMTPRTPNTTGGALQAQNVRRSSRLFSNNNYSVKENTKNESSHTTFPISVKYTESGVAPLDPS